METKKHKIDIFWILNTFDFFFFMVFSVLMWIVLYLFLSFIGVIEPNNTNPNKSNNNEAISKNEKPKETNFTLKVYEDSY